MSSVRFRTEWQRAIRGAIVLKNRAGTVLTSLEHYRRYGQGRTQAGLETNLRRIQSACRDMRHDAGEAIAGMDGRRCAIGAPIYAACGWSI